MILNREKAVLLAALVVFLAGSYRVVTAFINPSAGVRVLDLRLAQGRPEIPRPDYRRFTPPPEPLRNPFSVSEGWRRLDALPLDPPPLPSLGRIRTPLSMSPSVDAGGLRWQEFDPKEVVEDPDGGTGAGDSSAGEKEEAK
jgi:hypothetical protein